MLAKAKRCSDDNGMSESALTCYEVTSHVSERLDDEFPEVEYYVLGGVATGAVASYVSVDITTRKIVPTRD